MPGESFEVLRVLGARSVSFEITLSVSGDHSVSCDSYEQKECLERSLRDLRVLWTASVPWEITPSVSREITPCPGSPVNSDYAV